MGGTSSDDRESGPQWGSPPTKAQISNLQHQLQKTGLELGNYFHHPVFGTLLQGELVRPSRQAPTNDRRIPVHIKEFSVTGEQNATLTYQYLVRQEQTENTAFPRIYVHLIQPSDSQSQPHQKKFDVKVVLEPLQSTLRTAIQDRIGKNTYFEETSLLQIAHTTARGLSELHDQTLSHEDISPDSFILSSRDRYKLYHPLVLQSIATNKQNALAGRKSYISPEALKELAHRNATGYDRTAPGSSARKNTYNKTTADMFSLGLTLLEAATLEPEGRYYSSTGELDVGLLRKKLRKIAHVYSRDFVTLLSKLLAIEPEERNDLYDLIRATNRMKEQAQKKADAQIEKSRQKVPKIWDNEPTNTQFTQSTIKTPQTGWSKPDMMTPPGPFDKGFSEAPSRSRDIKKSQTSASKLPPNDLAYSSVRAPNSARGQPLHHLESFAPVESNRSHYQLPDERSRSRSYPKKSPAKYSSLGADQYGYDPDPKSDAIKIIERNNQIAREKERAERARHSHRSSRPSSQIKPKPREPILEESNDWTPAQKYPPASDSKHRRYDSSEPRPKVEVVTKVKEVTPGLDFSRIARPSSRPPYETPYSTNSRPSYTTPARNPNDYPPTGRPPRASRITPKGVEIVVDAPINPSDSDSQNTSSFPLENNSRYRSRPREPAHFMEEDEYSTDGIEDGVPKYIRVRHFEHSRDGTKKLLNEEERVFDSQYSLDNEETIKEIWKLQRDREKVGPVHPPSKTIATQTPGAPVPTGPNSSFGTMQIQTSPFNTDAQGYKEVPPLSPEALLPPGAKFFIAAPAGLDTNLPPLPLFSLDPLRPPPQPTIQPLPQAPPPRPPQPPQQTGYYPPAQQNAAPQSPTNTLGGDPIPRHTRSSHISSTVTMPPPLPVVVTERAASPSLEPKVTRITKPPVVRRDLSKNIDDPIAKSYHGYTVGQIVERKYALQPDSGEIVEELLRKVESGVRREKKPVVDATGLLLAPAANVDTASPVEGTGGKLLRDCIKRYPQNGFMPSPDGPPRVLEKSSIFHEHHHGTAKNEHSPFFLESMEEDQFIQEQRLRTPDGTTSPRFANSNQNSKPVIQIPEPVQPPKVPINQPRSPQQVNQNNLQLPPQQTYQQAPLNTQPTDKKEPLRLRFQKINGKDVPVGIDNPGMSDSEKRKILEMYLKKEGLPTTMIEQLLGTPNTQPPTSQTMAPTPPIVVTPSGQPSPGTNTRVYRPADDVRQQSPPPQSFTTATQNYNSSGASSASRQPQYAPPSNPQPNPQNQQRPPPPAVSMADESFDGGRSYFNDMQTYTQNDEMSSPAAQDNRGPSIIDEIQRKPYESNSALSAQSMRPNQPTNQPNPNQQAARTQAPQPQYNPQPAYQPQQPPPQTASSLGYSSQPRQPPQQQPTAVQLNQQTYLSPTEPVQQQSPQQLNNTTFYGAGARQPTAAANQQATPANNQAGRTLSPPGNANTVNYGGVAQLRPASPPNLIKQSSSKPVQPLAKLSSTKKAQRQFQQQMGASGMLGEIQEDEDFMGQPDEDIFDTPSAASRSYQKTVEGSRLERDAQARDEFGFESSMPSEGGNGRAAYNPGFGQASRGYNQQDMNFESQFIDQSAQNQSNRGGFGGFDQGGSGSGFSSASANKPNIVVTPPSPRVAASRHQMGNSTVRVSTAPQQVKNSSISGVNRSPVGFSAFGSVTSSMGQGLGEEAFGDFGDDGFGDQAQTQEQWQMASYRAGRESTF